MHSSLVYMIKESGVQGYAASVVDHALNTLRQAFGKNPFASAAAEPVKEL